MTFLSIYIQTKGVWVFIYCFALLLCIVLVGFLFAVTLPLLNNKMFSKRIKFSLSTLFLFCTGYPTPSVSLLKSNRITLFALRKINFGPFQSSFVHFSSRLEEKDHFLWTCFYSFCDLPVTYCTCCPDFLFFVEEEDRISVLLERTCQNYFKDWLGLEAWVQIVRWRFDF